MEDKPADKHGKHEPSLAVRITDEAGSTPTALVKDREYRVEIGGHSERPLVFAVRLM